MKNKVFALVFVSLLLPGHAGATLTSENYVVQGSSVATDGVTLNASSTSYQTAQEPGDLYRLPVQNTSNQSAAQTGTKVPYENSILYKNDIITICHTDNGKGYIALTATLEKSIGVIELHGHTGHNEDIIPPFRYDTGNGVLQYLGNNWNSETQKIFARNCTSFLETTLLPNDASTPAASISGNDANTNQPFKFPESFIPKIFKRETVFPPASNTPASFAPLAPATTMYRVLIAASIFFGLLSGITLALVQLAQAPFSTLTIGRLFSQGWNNLLVLLAFKKKHKPWGTIYDSVTKAPVDPAYVELFDSHGTKQAEAITDLDGRYGFLVQEGSYTMQVRKTNYLFPSRLQTLTGDDVIYSQLYYGGPFTVSGTITHDVPMDPVNFDWNQYEKLRTKQTKYFNLIDPIVVNFLDLVFFLGIIFMVWQFLYSPNFYTSTLLACYAILLAHRFIAVKPMLYGTISEDGKPLQFALVKILIAGQTLQTKVTDAHGRYLLIVPPANYFLSVEKRVNETTYLPVFNREINARKGIINARIKL